MDGEALALIGLVALAAWIATRSQSASAATAQPYRYGNIGDDIQLPGSDSGIIVNAMPTDYGLDYSPGAPGADQIIFRSDYYTPTPIDEAPAQTNRAPWLVDVSEPDPTAPYDMSDMGGNAQTDWQPPAKAAPYLDAIASASATYGLPDNLLAALINQESRFNPIAVSSAGAQGIAQFMPATAADFGIDPFNPAQAIPAAAKYLRALYDRTGSWSMALAAYNWGIGNLTKYGYAKAPAETRTYVAIITTNAGVA